jgi:hypothetical protein
MDNYDLIYIEPSTPEIKQIKDLIKKQGDKACQNQLSIESISESVSKFTFGWVSVLQKAQLGRRSIKSLTDRYTLLSFILCHYTPLIPEQITIELVCSTTRSGKLMMELAEERARTLNIKRINLYSLSNDKLKRWYESLGYVYVNTIYLQPGVPKIYVMIKPLMSATVRP